MAVPIVVDLSHWNPDPDFAKMKSAGVVGVIFKATEAVSTKDATYPARSQKALSAGLCVSAYHFLRKGNIDGQVSNFLGYANLPTGARACADHEADATLDELVAFLKEIRKRRPDLQLTVYSGHLIKDQLGGKKNDWLAANTSLWLAQYTSGSPSWPTATWPAWSLWQYTDKASVPGISQPVDGNQWNGSSANLVKWFGWGGQAAPAPTPDPEPEPATVEITTTGSVRVIVNGQVVTYE